LYEILQLVERLEEKEFYYCKRAGTYLIQIDELKVMHINTCNIWKI